MRVMRLVLAALMAVAALPASATDRKWINGKWFDGRGFVSATFYSVDGVLTKVPPRKRVLEVVDLKGQHVVPAFGDAHHHGIDSEVGLSEKVAAFLRDGIFYVKNPNVIPDYLTPSMRSRLNRVDSIDVVFANGGLTGTGGHPGPLHDHLASRNVFPGLAAADMPGRAYFFIDSEEDLARLWPGILAGKPDFIKTFLNGEEEVRHPDRVRGPEHGLPPQVLVQVVQRAHAAGLRVSAHVDTAKDVGMAVRAGVDELNHMPLPNPLHDRDLSAFVIDRETADEAARRGTVIVPTASVIPRLSGARWDTGMAERLVENQRSNIRTLLDSGVTLGVGSDGISGETPFVTAASEIRYLHKHRLADKLTLLKMWSENTPRTIFPLRKIGRLADGFEANFLVLAGNPLEDFDNVARIRLRVKSGEILTVER